MPLTMEQFDGHMTRVVQCFGPTQFKQERVKFIWNMVKHLEDWQFKRIVDGFISRSRTAPLPDDFQQAVKFHTRPSAASGQMPKDPNCDRCGGGGFMIAKGEEDFEALVLCECGSANEAGKFPFQSADLVKGHVISRVRDGFFIPSQDRNFEKITSEWRTMRELSLEYWKHRQGVVDGVLK